MFKRIPFAFGRDLCYTVGQKDVLSVLEALWAVGALRSTWSMEDGENRWKEQNRFRSLFVMTILLCCNIFGN